MEELFETFDETGQAIGLVARSVVHRTGLWHRSVHVFLFRPDGALYLQLRSPDKDIYPGCWDLSVGEHLKPGENYAAGARRGLQEELGIQVDALEPLGEVVEYRCEIPDRGIIDHELQQTFRATTPTEPIPDGLEVAAIRAIDARELKDWMARAPEAFTPWLRHELRTRPGLGSFTLADD